MCYTTLTCLAFQKLQTSFHIRSADKTVIFIVRQHAMHEQRDIVLPILSVCPSVQCRYSVKTF